MFPLRLCGGKLLVVVTRERRYGPSRLRVLDDDDDGNCGVITQHQMTASVTPALDFITTSRPTQTQLTQP